ncbi:SDR family NAD(P)-dependent oxidoreductase [Rhizobium rhizogenes]|uniref:Oxidoreductase n=2 Tax=Rhizobium rhizogenes TaxID=359 RepID=A0AA87QFD9_RHIRH|nr:SDR family oxidoreductase [Rhizobium rhizogenes]NTG65135.1 SDR family oxidoreductase [Rhizobium rhizogenes]NTG71684.1 SDR family oxidoreductase [Rhizobium rhizogenes]NTG84485.1 SDR family oxidoreductase [Rhizobium rhizogenes]NTH29755.1 SDR family oxidoreductase [Rhizobium rhizogenes]NTI00338.1 SDR family oxidoreductase [Rhizobium rhizogenes]
MRQILHVKPRNTKQGGDETAMGQLDAILTLTGRSALITGGASGMGRAASLLFAAHGAHVIIVDRNGEGADDTVEEIRRMGGSAEAHKVDLVDQNALDGFVDTFVRDHQVLDILFNHAGLPGPPAFQYDAESWYTCMAINVWVPMILTKRLLPQLRRSKSASIICTASIAGLRAVSFLPTYSASKAALIQFVKSAAQMLAAEGIRINAICPGATDTPALRRDLSDGTLNTTIEAIAASVPMKRMGTPQDMAHMALFLASDASSFMTGVAIPVDGGATA